MTVGICLLFVVGRHKPRGVSALAFAEGGVASGKRDRNVVVEEEEEEGGNRRRESGMSQVRATRSVLHGCWMDRLVWHKVTSDSAGWNCLAGRSGRQNRVDVSGGWCIMSRKECGDGEQPGEAFSNKEWTTLNGEWVG